MFRLCDAGKRYERLLKIAAIEEASIDLEKYQEVLEQILANEPLFKIPSYLNKLDFPIKDKGRLRAIRVNSYLINNLEDSCKKVTLVNDLIILSKSLLFSLGVEMVPEFPLCDYLQNKYIRGVA